MFLRPDGSGENFEVVTTFKKTFVDGNNEEWGGQTLMWET
jgi:hypothetical protein